MWRVKFFWGMRKVILRVILAILIPLVPVILSVLFANWAVAGHSTYWIWMVIAVVTFFFILPFSGIQIKKASSHLLDYLDEIYEEDKDLIDSDPELQKEVNKLRNKLKK